MSNESPPEPADIAACVVRALVLYSLAEFQSGHARTIRVTAKGSSFSVEDDGRGHAICRTVEGSPYLRFVYAHLEYPFEPGQGNPVQLQWMIRRRGGRTIMRVHLSCRHVAHGLNVVSIRIKDKGAVIRRMIVWA